MVKAVIFDLGSTHMIKIACKMAKMAIRSALENSLMEPKKLGESPTFILKEWFVMHKIRSDDETVITVEPFVYYIVIL